MRKGVSLTMTYVVIALILISTASMLILYFSGSMEEFQGIISAESGESQQQLARENCLTEKRQLCSQDKFRNPASGDPRWYDVAEYDGKKCKAYWTNTDPPGCK